MTQNDQSAPAMQAVAAGSYEQEPDLPRPTKFARRKQRNGIVGRSFGTHTNRRPDFEDTPRVVRDARDDD